MADMQVVREDGDGRRTILTLRVNDTAWSGQDTTVQIIEVRQEIDLDRAIPRQRITSPEQLRRAINPRR